ncbi:hypothetical protein ON010_g11509 [Phytophthora cinnamomi]|nr:hypothetical protein ON010_g11509 [Phytophthora cinnamomi]
MSKAVIVVVVIAGLAVLTDGGYVELYRDAGFKHKLARVDDVVLDACYRFTCKNVDNAITSAKWHGLPETGSFFEGGSATIAFYTGKNCDGTEKHWYIDTQSKQDRYFPDNFRLDGMNDDTSSFMVLNAGGNAGVMNVCYLPESGLATNATTDEGTALTPTARSSSRNKTDV